MSDAGAVDWEPDAIVRVLTGLERLLADPTLVPGERWALLTNDTAVTADLVSAKNALNGTGQLRALLAPEHGLHGTAQAGFTEQDATDSATGLPIIDVYAAVSSDIANALREMRVDAVIADIQDVGTRYYTYAATVIDVMTASIQAGIPFYVLDRPNPLNGVTREGPGLEPDFASLVGRLDVPIRHGLTLGELAQHAARSAGIQLPSVIRMEGWGRSMTWADTGLPWVMPSPNLPTTDTALVYPGTALFEGTTLSEGRGTTRPFEIVGAPWLTASYAASLNALGLPGVAFREARFVPTFSKHRGEVCVGVQVHVLDPGLFEPVRTGVEMLMLAANLGEGFGWLTPPDIGLGAQHFIDKLWGASSLREAIPGARQVSDVMAPITRGNMGELLY
ncbi:exo-beta-N-acetylmuramidase NamZ family protein [Flaviflexus sp.]|uniref:exo-beta-N-acetylmuramidase NamZ family protein n=1 Tax=Flaviflexus sp. TaxID=1969482 RepID=UPI003F920257